MNKTYDGSTSATVITSDDRVDGDDLTLAHTAAFGDKNAGAGKAINVSGVSLSGADAANYVLASASGSASADITRKQLTISDITALDKTYDGNTNAVVNWGELSGLVGNDTISVTATGRFDTPNPGTGKTVTVSYTLASATGAAGNYSLASTTTTADINPAEYIQPPSTPSLPSPANPGAPLNPPPLISDGGNAGTTPGTPNAGGFGVPDVGSTSPGDSPDAGNGQGGTNNGGSTVGDPTAGDNADAAQGTPGTGGTAPGGSANTDNGQGGTNNGGSTAGDSPAGGTTDPSHDAPGAGGMAPGGSPNADAGQGGGIGGSAAGNTPADGTADTTQGMTGAGSTAPDRSVNAGSSNSQRGTDNGGSTAGNTPAGGNADATQGTPDAGSTAPDGSVNAGNTQRSTDNGGSTAGNAPAGGNTAPTQGTPGASGTAPGSSPNADNGTGQISLGLDGGSRDIQFISTGDTTTLVLTAKGAGGEGGENGGTADGANNIAPRSAAILLFTQSGDAIAPAGALTVVEQGQSLKASSASTEVASIPAVNQASMQFVTVDYRLPAGKEDRVTVGISPDGVLVVKVSPLTKAAMDDRSIVLLGIAIAKERLNQEVAGVKGVVIQVNE